MRLVTATETDVEARDRLCLVVLTHQEAVANHDKALAKQQDAIAAHTKAKTKITLLQAKAIKELRDRKLYLLPMPCKSKPGTLVKYKSIQDFCLDNFANISRSRIYQLIAWADLPVSTNPDFVGALNEGQARELANADPEDRELAYKMAGSEGATALQFSHYLDGLGEQEHLRKLQQAADKAKNKPAQETKDETHVIESLEIKLATMTREARRGLSPEKAAAFSAILEQAARVLRA